MNFLVTQNLFCKPAIKEKKCSAFSCDRDIKFSVTVEVAGSDLKTNPNPAFINDVFRKI